MKSFRERVSSVYYTHGLLCASHPFSVFTVTFSFVFLCCYPLSKLPFPGNAPLQHTVPVNEYVIPADVVRRDDVVPTNDDGAAAETQTPIWHEGPSAGFILQVVVKATVSPWRRQILNPVDAFRTPLSKAFDIVDLINRQQIKKGDQTYGVADLCLQAPETLPNKGVNLVLPQYNCLIVSPANLWQLQKERFQNDGEIMKTIYKVAHNLEKSPLLKDILFGVPWQETGMSRFFVRNRQRVISFAVTVVMSAFDVRFVDELGASLERAFPLPARNDTGAEKKLTHIYFKARNYFFLEYTPLIFAYIVLFLYIYFSVRKIEMVKSKWGLALASVATVIASLFMSIGICTFFGLQPILLGAKIYEIFPYLVVIVGLENALILTKSVVSTPMHQDVKFRVAEGLYKEGWGITKNLIYELLILLFGFFTFVPEIQEFCLFACVGLLSDFFLQMMFFATVLSIDIRRMELTDLKSQHSFHELSVIKHPEPVMGCPFQYMRSSPARRMDRSKSYSVADGARGERFYQQEQSPKRLRFMEFLARYRMVQRLLMFCTSLWIALILYKTGLAAHMMLVTMNATMSPPSLGNDVNTPVTLATPDDKGSASAFDDVTRDAPNGERVLMHDELDHWTKLSNAHWPTLFSFYNISIWNRYITILPPVHLAISIDPDEAVRARHPSEVRSNLDWLPPAPALDLESDLGWFSSPADTDPEHADNPTKLLMLKAKQFYPRTKREFYVTVGLAVTSTVLVAYAMTWLYGCMCSRHYSRWRSGWGRGRARKQRRPSAYSKQIKPGIPLLLIGHEQEVECIECNGDQVVSSCLAGDIRVWDSSTGQCLTVIQSLRSREAGRSRDEDDLYDPIIREIDTDFAAINASAAPQNGADTGAYDFSAYCELRREQPVGRAGRRARRRTEVASGEPPIGERRNRTGSKVSEEPVSPPIERVSQIWCLACQDALIIAGCADGRVEFWDTKGQLKCVHAADKSGVTGLVFRGCRVVAARLSGCLDFLLLETFVSTSVPDSSGDGARKIYMRGDFRVGGTGWRGAGASGAGSLVNLNDIVQCSLAATHRAHQRAITALRSEGGRLVTASQDHTLKLYKLEDCMCLYTLHGHGAPITTVYLDQNAPLGAVSGCDKGDVRVWDLLTGACVHKLTRPQLENSTSNIGQSIVDVVCTPVYVISSSVDQCMCIWERCRGILLHCLKQETMSPTRLAMLTSNLLVSTSQGRVNIWDVSRGDLLQALQLADHDESVFIRQLLVVNNALLVCDYGRQVRCVPFPSVLEPKTE